jgi:hypothetical protein
MPAFSTCRTVALLLLCIGAGTGCSDTQGPSPSVGSIALDLPYSEIEIGASVQIAATVINTNGVMMAAQTLQWSSLQPAIASVSAGGLVTGHSSGSATIQATGGGHSASVVVFVRPPHCTAAQATATVAIGQTVSGQLGAGDCSIGGGFADGWRLTLPSRAGVSVELASSRFDGIIVITDTSLNVLAWGADSDGSGTVRLVQPLDAGQHIVWATAWSLEQQGPYSLTINTADLCSGAPTHGSLALDAPQSGSIASNDCVLPHSRPGHGRRLVVTERTGIEITMRSADFIPLLVVADETLEPLAIGFPIYAPDEVHLYYVFEPGEYVVWSTIADGAGGSYEVVASRAPFISCAQTPTPLAIGSSAGGTLAPSDCVTRDGRYADPWALTLDAATRLRIDLTSTQFDALLFVTDADGEIVAFDDDSGSGYNARIVSDFAAGTYTIWATSYHAYALGSYQLAVTLSPGGATSSVTSNLPAQNRSAPVQADVRAGYAPASFESDGTAKTRWPNPARRSEGFPSR